MQPYKREIKNNLMKIQNPIVQSNYIASQGSNTSENSAN